MEYLVDATPQECVQSGMAYMVNEGYAIDSQSDTSVTLSRTYKPSGSESCLFMLMVLITLGLALLMLLVWLFIKWRVTIVAAPAPEGRTRLTVTGSHPKPREHVETWIREAFGEHAMPADPSRL